MTKFVPTLAVLAGLIATAHAQTDQVAGTSSAASVSRLSRLVLDPIPDQADVPVYANDSASRLGGIQLAQIPQQTGLPPGQNPNRTPRTGAPSMHSPLGPPGGNPAAGGQSSVISSAGSPGNFTPGNPGPGNPPAPGTPFPGSPSATGGSPGRPVSAVPTSKLPQPAMAAVPARAPATMNWCLSPSRTC